jgi:hypothetical protein
VAPVSIRRALLSSATLATLLGCMAAAAHCFPDIKPAPQQTQWQDLEFGVILHFGTNTFLDREWATAPPGQGSSTQSSSIRNRG